MKRLSMLGAIAVVATTAAASARADAPADEKAACASAYEEAQTTRMSGKLLRARELLQQCARPACPRVVQRDCSKWYDEVEASIPTIVFDAKGKDGKDIVDVTVSLDGTVITRSLDGKAVSLDPGPHTIVLEHAGDPPIEQKVVIKESEKARRIGVSWEPPKPTGPADGSGGTGTIVLQPTAPRKGPPTGAWVLLGTGAAAIAVGGVFGALGLAKRSDLDACKGRCSSSEVDGVRTRFLVADVAFGVGAAALVGAGVIWLLSSPKSSERVGLSISPSRVDLSGTF